MQSMTQLVLNNGEAPEIVYIHTYIHTYIHACIHTYIHTYAVHDSAGFEQRRGTRDCVFHGQEIELYVSAAASFQGMHAYIYYLCVCVYIYIYIYSFMDKRSSFMCLPQHHFKVYMYIYIICVCECVCVCVCVYIYAREVYKTSSI